MAVANTERVNNTTVNVVEVNAGLPGLCITACRASMDVLPMNIACSPSIHYILSYQNYSADSY